MEMVYHIHRAESPIIAAAIHDGHLLAAPLVDYMHLQAHERFREEDPYTADMADLPVSRIFVDTSRFQTDLNRRRDQAVYRQPEDAWGLTVWRPVLPELIVRQLLEGYDRFYSDVAQLLQQTIALFGYFMVLDIHSYNHRRHHPQEIAHTSENPEINLGSGHNHERWKPVGHRVVSFLAHHQINGRFLDVRENVKFKGGGFAEWVNRNYGDYGCVLSLEFKKTFMDEWTGRVDLKHLSRIKSMLKGAIPFLLDKLDDMANFNDSYGH